MILVQFFSASILGRVADLDRDRIIQVVVGLFALLVVVDLVARLTGTTFTLGPGPRMGGDLALGEFGRRTWTGLLVGLIFGLAGIGLSMTYSILNFANFSHGDLMTTGAFTGWGVTLLIAGWDVGDPGYLLFALSGSGPGPGAVGASIVSSPIAVIVGVFFAAGATIAVALLIDHFVYKPMRDRGGIPLLIASIGVALALRNLIQFLYGSRTRGITGTENVRQDVLGISLDLHQVTLFVVALALMVSMHLLLQQTKLGKAMRAMADNKDLALVTGIPTERVVRATWVLGAGLVGVAGFLFVLERGTMDFNLGWFLLLFVFAAVILGGIGSIYGAIAGGLIIGLVQELSLIWISSDFNFVVAFLIMILVLLYRPEGVFSGVTTA